MKVETTLRSARRAALVVVVIGFAGWGGSHFAESSPRDSTQKERVEKHKPIDIQVGKSKCTLRYIESGPANGLAVVLLHGGRFTADTWVKTQTISALAASGFHVYAVDLPGFGKTRCPDAKSDVFLKQVFASLEIAKAVLVSPSMSGRFSFPLITTSPELIAGFVAVAPVGIPRFSKKLQGSSLATLAIWGEKDRVVPVAHADMLVKAMSNVRKVVLKGANHPCYLDNPATFNKELVSFVTKCGTKVKN